MLSVKNFGLKKIQFAALALLVAIPLRSSRKSQPPLSLEPSPIRAAP